MTIIISITLRALYLYGVAFLALGIGIGVAMGFDGGATPLALALALLYLLIFIPATLLSVTPLKIITHPPLLLKAWYWLAGFFFTSFLALLLSEVARFV
ncbi:MAG TPA: hypothetical protein VFW42_10010 [Fluviicoccus sp.]|nr:hypothetical protein [Fluviicoccus sp.]